MLKTCTARHDVIWYHGMEDNAFDCPLCATIAVLEKSGALPGAEINLVPIVPKTNRKGRPMGRPRRKDRENQ
jgi:hypothetical protein